MPSTMLHEGDRAPDFSLVSSDGTKCSLKDFSGKKLVLYFYPKDDTPGCTKEACSFTENLARVRRKGAAVIGVSADSVESHGKFARKYSLAFPLLSDPARETIGAYGVWKEKSFMGRKFMGIERTTFIIDEKGIITKIFRKVKVNGHTDEVLGAL